jgi:hypothetical protein
VGALICWGEDFVFAVILA